MLSTCFKVALNYEEMKKDSQKITIIKPFINKSNREEINFLLEKDDWKRFEKNNITVALNVLYAKKEKIYPASVSKQSPNRAKQVILLMTANGGGRKGQRCHYLVVKYYLYH